MIPVLKKSKQLSIEPKEGHTRLLDLLKKKTEKVINNFDSDWTDGENLEALTSVLVEDFSVAEFDTPPLDKIEHCLGALETLTTGFVPSETVFLGGNNPDSLEYFLLRLLAEKAKNDKDGKILPIFKEVVGDLPVVSSSGDFNALISNIVDLDKDLSTFVSFLAHELPDLLDSELFKSVKEDGNRQDVLDFLEEEFDIRGKDGDEKEFVASLVRSLVAAREKGYDYHIRILDNRKREAEQATEEGEDRAQRSEEYQKRLDALGNIASRKSEAEQNMAKYTVQFAVTASSKRKREERSGAHIRAVAKGPFPIDLTKRFKNTKLVSEILSNPVLIGTNEYKFTFVPHLQGIYQIVISVYSKESSLSPLYFAITNTGGFWLKVTADGKVEKTSWGDITKKSSGKVNKKKAEKGLEDFKAMEIAKERDEKRAKLKELLDREIKSFVVLKEVVTVQEEGISELQIEEKKRLLVQFNENALINFRRIMDGGLSVKMVKQTMFSYKVKAINVSYKVERGKLNIFNLQGSQLNKLIISSFDIEKTRIYGDACDEIIKAIKPTGLIYFLTIKGSRSELVLIVEDEFISNYLVEMISRVIKDEGCSEKLNTEQKEDNAQTN